MLAMEHLSCWARGGHSNGHSALLDLHMGEGRVEHGPEHWEKINSSLSAFASLALYLQMMQKLKYSTIQSNAHVQDELLH